ncbi:MAG: OmpA family protein [Myxococcota bacterium]|nr:OmpA family protein [Myxococcota bacterium]
MRTMNSSARCVFVATALAALLSGTSSHAQTVVTPGIALNRFEPSERGSDWFASESLDLRGTVRPALGVIGDYGYKAYVLRNPDGSENTSLLLHQFFLHVGGALTLFDRLRIAASLPIALVQEDSDDDPNATNRFNVDGNTYIAPTGGGIGDLRLALDLRLAGEYGDPFTIAIGGRVWLPTGDETQYLGDGKVRVGPHIYVAGDISAFVYSAGVGVVYRANDQPFAGHATGTQLDFNAAAGLRVADRRLVIGPEVFGSTVLTQGSAVFGDHTTPLALIVGAHYDAGGVRFGLGAGPGLSNAAGTPLFRALASLEWMPDIAAQEQPAKTDRDGDGILDGEDACPDVAGIRTADPKTNGCPADRDGDGVPDTEDACPDVPGVKTADPKTNGCPADRDGDGVPDTEDACPDVPGVKTADPKTNGCPADRDGDGVPDAEDACPDVAGVKTADRKTNGCPADRDGDGVPDTEDACPDVPGPRNADPKKNGCPLVRIEAGQVKILEQIKFKFNSADIVDSQPLIDAVASTLKDHPEIKHLRVEGHTDNVGSPVYNKELSRRRAASVEKALVAAGVAKQRLSSNGFGLERPSSDNSTEEGRAANRRVEFHIEDTATAPASQRK